jgi:hypothetical protein
MYESRRTYHFRAVGGQSLVNECAAMRGKHLSSPAVYPHTARYQGTPTQQHDIADGSETMPARLVFCTINEVENCYHYSS